MGGGGGGGGGLSPNIFYLYKAEQNSQTRKVRTQKPQYPFASDSFELMILNIDIRKRDGLATLLLSIYYLQLSSPEANIAQLVW